MLDLSPKNVRPLTHGGSCHFRNMMFPGLDSGTYSSCTATGGLCGTQPLCLISVQQETCTGLLPLSDANGKKSLSGHFGAADFGFCRWWTLRTTDSGLFLPVIAYSSNRPQILLAVPVLKPYFQVCQWIVHVTTHDPDKGTSPGMYFV